MNTSQNGNVPFYSSGDGSTTFRIPKVVGYIKGVASQSEAGAYTAEGLPNVTGSLGWWKGVEGSYASGALALDKHTTISDSAHAAASKSTTDKISLDASRSSSVYGNSDHVTPETATVLFGVYAFGEITNVGALDADTLATGLATVESNLASKLENSTAHIVETWSSGSNWYRKWSNGWIEQGGECSAVAYNSTTINASFPTAFSTTDYTAQSNAIDSAGNTYMMNTRVANLQTTGMTVRGAQNSGTNFVVYKGKCRWYACGY